MNGKDMRYYKVTDPNEPIEIIPISELPDAIIKAQKTEIALLGKKLQLADHTLTVISECPTCICRTRAQMTLNAIKAVK